MTTLCATCPLNRDPTQPLSGRQAQLLRFLGQYHRRSGIMPAYSEIAEALGVRSLASVSELVGTLEGKGWISRRHNVARSITLTAAAVEWVAQYGDAA